MQYLAIFVGGGLGSLLRFAFSKINGESYAVLPFGTIIANFLSCIVLGFVMALLVSKTPVSPSVKLFFAVGFCGGFSTFSTFSFETYQFLEKGDFLMAFVNVFMSIFVCLVALYIGISLQKWME